MPHRADDGSILGDDGEVLFFSTSRFVTEICQSDNCFLCGKSRQQGDFDDEHVVPQWLLRKFDMFGESITLPNTTRIRYDKYTVPCCVECNRFLGRELETPISELLSHGMSSYTEYIDRVGIKKLFIWLSLMFFKTHYKDRLLRMHRDQRMPSDRIADLYEWEDLHHIHCLIRSIYINQEIHEDVIGSVCVFRVKKEDHFSWYDYHDLYSPRSVMIRIDDVGVVAVLNDAGAANIVFDENIQKISGPLSPLQLREVLAHFSYINELLKNRPRFATLMVYGDQLKMIAEVPAIFMLNEKNNQQLGTVMEACCGPVLRQIRVPDVEELMEKVRKAEWSSLFYDDFGFQHNSMDLL
jgi:hypothetical protein